MSNPRKWPAYHPLHYLPANAKTILDIGCNEGALLAEAFRIGATRLYGIDINPHAVETSKNRLADVPDHVIAQGSADELPFDNESVDAAFCAEVMEHVPAELRPGLIREAHRVLRPGAPLVLTTPAAGMFQGLDPANLRLRLPGLFRGANALVGGVGRERGYEGQKHGIVWHHHFTLDELRSLLSERFHIRVVRYRACLVAPIVQALQWPWYRSGRADHPIRRMLHRLEHWDYSIRYPTFLGFNMLIVAEKR